MLDLPKMHGATATVLIAVYILAWDDARKSSSIRPPPMATVVDGPFKCGYSAVLSIEVETLPLRRRCPSLLNFSEDTSTHIGKWWTNLYFFTDPLNVIPHS